jgi:uncharacterized protein YneF (UPF0154 family)
MSPIVLALILTVVCVISFIGGVLFAVKLINDAVSRND